MKEDACERAHTEGRHVYTHHVQNQIDRVQEAIVKAGLALVPDDSPDAYDLDCLVPLRLDSASAVTDDEVAAALVDDLRAEFDQGHFIDWDRVVPYIARRTDAALRAALTDPEKFGWRGLPAYAIAYAAAIRDVLAHLDA